MEIRNAAFVTSLKRYGPFPGIGLPQIAVAGRSNVGKSSLINSLCRRKKLAMTSATPGKTRMINVFRINGDAGDAFHLVDLPGYGFARVSKEEQASWGLMMQEYFDSARELRLTLALVDIRHEPTADDVSMIAYLRSRGLPFRVVATKADKVSRGSRMKYTQPICMRLQVQPWELICTSSETGEGMGAVLNAVGEAVQEKREE